MVYTMKLERNLWLGCYSYFILLLDKRKETPSTWKMVTKKM